MTGVNPLYFIVGMALLGLAPFFLMMVTSYVKIVVVTSLVRNALGVAVHYAHGLGARPAVGVVAQRKAPAAEMHAGRLPPVLCDSLQKRKVRRQAFL